MQTLEALEDEIVIHLPPARVWELLTDWAAAPAWLPGIEEMHVDGAAGPGQVLVYSSGGHERRYTLSTLDPGRGLTMVSGGPEDDLAVEYGYLLVPDAAWTRVGLRVAVRAAEAFAEEGLGLAAALADAEAGQLEALRDYAEKAP